MDIFSLKKRSYLGTTSMSAEWSLLMANMGLVRTDCFVFDPFVGTGADLIPLFALSFAFLFFLSVYSQIVGFSFCHMV
jgi:tRNA G10  N-methylase Trm11